MENNTDNSSIYTTKEATLLEKIQDNLIMMTDNVIRKADPESKTYKSDLRVVNEVYANISKSVQDSATIRSKHQDNANKEAIIASVAETLKMISQQKIDTPRLTEEVTPTDAITDVEIDNTELIIDVDKLNIDDFTNS